MELLKCITLFYCIYLTFASEHTHIIPVEKYDTELQELGQHVEIPETPVRVIKITKTIAVKVPVPYPVKVIEKVPYPVHISKPYPVPVPQIVKIPHVLNPKDKSGHEALDVGSYQGHQFDGNSYQVQEHPSSDSTHNYSPDTEQQTYGATNGGEHSLQNDDFDGVQSGGSYGYHPSSHDGANAFESNSYDQAIQNYLENHGTNKGLLHY